MGSALFCLLETEAGLEREAVPTVLGKIPVRKGGIFSVACGKLGMRTDSIQDSALFSSLGPVPGPGVPALAWYTLTCLRPAGGRELCLSDLPRPIWSLCWLIPGACFPKSCPGYPAMPGAPFSPSVFWGLTVADTFLAGAAQGD